MGGGSFIRGCGRVTGGGYYLLGSAIVFSRVLLSFVLSCPLSLF